MLYSDHNKHMLAIQARRAITFGEASRPNFGHARYGEERTRNEGWTVYGNAELTIIDLRRFLVKRYTAARDCGNKSGNFLDQKERHINACPRSIKSDQPSDVGQKMK